MTDSIYNDDACKNCGQLSRWCNCGSFEPQRRRGEQLAEKPVEEEQEWLFTFGYGHAYPNRFVRIHGTFGSAREKMFSLHGPKWAFQYPHSKEKDLLSYGITEITL